MDALHFLLVLAVSTTNVWAAQFFCVGVDCKNVTLYLGPRFGSKIIQLSPLQPNITFPTDTNSTSWKSGANSTADFRRNLGRTANNQNLQKALQRALWALGRTNTTTTTAAPFWRWASKQVRPAEPRVVYGTYRPFPPRYHEEPRAPPSNSYNGAPKYPKVAYGTYRPSLDYGVPIGPLIPRVRPVLTDGSQTVDLTGDDATQDWYRPRDVHSSANSLSKGVLALTGRGYSGEDVKEVLGNLSSTNLTCITRLMLDANLISYFPNLTFPVELEYSLNQLWMDDNPRLDYWRSSTWFEISRLRNLKLLSLSNISLSYWYSLNLPQLEVLYLKNNYLSEIPQGFNNLRQLHLTNNRIHYISPSSLASYTNLRLLDLSGNKIISLYDHPFMPLRRLETLYLQNNSLAYVTDIDVPHSAILFLGHNRWVCSCQLVELVNQRWPQVVDKENINCTDDMSRSFKPVTSVGFAPCRDPRRWLRSIGETFEHVFRWCGRMGLNWHNISNFLYWTILIAAAYVIVKVVLAKNFKIIRVPYNILDDKQAIIDDKQAIIDDKNAINDENPATFENTVLQFSDKIAIINKKNNP